MWFGPRRSRLDQLQMLMSHRDRPMRRRVLAAVLAPASNKKPASGEPCARPLRLKRNREAAMNRKTAGIVFTMSVTIAALTGTAGAQNSPGSAALDSSLRSAIERTDVPGVVALITDRER